MPRKTGTISDYGGFAYGGSKKTQFRASAIVSMRCLECEKLRYLAPRELSRAAAPRCLDCGGALGEIEVSKKRRGLSHKQPYKRPPSRRCPACGEQVFNNEGLHKHLTLRVDCVDYHRREGFVYNGRIIVGSVIITKDRGESTYVRWYVRAVTIDNGSVTLKTLHKRYECVDWIRDQFGPVEYAGPMEPLHVESEPEAN